jgi:putative ATP-dependent endonuclease of the OLD family
LDDLNSIFEPDTSFTRILVQQLQDERWEVFLEEAEKGRVSLSQSGSGLKTVLLGLVYLHLVPAIEKKGTP